jgi:hypothetical protein
MLTFQIGLHIDDLFILEYIKNKLNSSKYHQFILFVIRKSCYFY